MSFGSPAADYVENKLDLNRFLIRNNPATFFLRMDNNNFAKEGIFQDDVLIVDRSLPPQPGKWIITESENGFQLSRYQKPFSTQKLFWGRVTSVIRKF